ncbi:MAG: thiamine-phosphate kinase [Candidatus Bathyarchaeota archaeon]|nr:thiamine-phosphate kinase [Candidatus Bathyarchaeota archaeon]
MDKRESNESVSELGEHRIIEIMEKRLVAMPDIAVPFGDDVSAVDIGGGRVAVLKTDMLVAKTDVPKDMSLYQAARKAIVMNVSDFASKGVVPTMALVALGLPEHFTEAQVESIADGLNDGAREYGAYIVGGDTNETQDLIISISLFGTAEKNHLMLRSGAKPGDLLAVTGLFGKTSAGLRLLLAGGVTSQDLDRRLSEAVFVPKARLAEGLALAGSGAASASMDSSDGLAWSLHELAHQSNVGFVVDRVPLAGEAAEFAMYNDLEAADLALYGGEEYELVVTLKPDMWAAAEAAVKAAGGNLERIGYVTAEKHVLLKVGGDTQIIEPRGWEHFKSGE